MPNGRLHKKYRESQEEGSSAIDFLLTYGWAILIVLIVAGVLVYYGFFHTTEVDCSVPADFLKNSIGYMLNTSEVRIECYPYFFSSSCKCKVIQIFDGWEVVTSTSDWTKIE